MSDQLNAGATSEITRTLKTIHIIHSHIHSNKEDEMDDYDVQMIFGDLVGLKLPDICPTGEGKPRKPSPRKLVPTGNRTWVRCVADAHGTGCSTAVDMKKI